MIVSILTAIGVTLGIFCIYMFSSFILDKYAKYSFRKMIARRVVGTGGNDESCDDEDTKVEPIEFNKTPCSEDPSRSNELGNYYNTHQ